MSSQVSTTYEHTGLRIRVSLFHFVLGGAGITSLSRVSYLYTGPYHTLTLCLDKKTVKIKVKRREHP